MIQIDKIDKEILNVLQQNDKISYQELGQQLKKPMVASTIHNRVKKMEKEGIINSYSAIVNPFKAGYGTIAWLGLSVEPIKIEEVAKVLYSYDDVQTVVISSGEHDIVVQIIATDEKALWRFINEKVKTIKGVKPQMDVSSFIDIFKMTHKIKFEIDN